MKRQVLSVISLLFADGLGLLLSLLAALALRQFLLPMLSGFFLVDVPWRIEYLWLFPILAGVFAYEGLYTRRRTLWEEFRHLLRGVSVSMILFLAVMTVLKHGEDISRPAVFLAWLIAPGVLIGLRSVLKKRVLKKSVFWRRNVLIAGFSSEASQLAVHLECFPELGYHLAGFLCDGELGPADAQSRCGSLNDLERAVKEHRIDEVIIALPEESRLRQFELLKKAEALVPRVSVLPELFDADKLNVEVEKVERYFLLSFSNNLMKRSNRLLKDLSEILLLLLFLPLWAPLLLVLALTVKVTSRGPVLFSQQRIGQEGLPFQCFKFRTMAADAEEQLERYLENNPAARRQWEAERKLKDDPRITAVGKILRKTSLDELPQFFNVLKGEMSLVGPRPIVEGEIEKYGEYFTYYRAVCPGLSGLWQVSGRNDIDYNQRVMLDTFYVRNWSLWLDFMIILRTIPAVLRKDGAY